MLLASIPSPGKDHQVAELVALILEIARVFPGKRNRWLKLVRHDRPLFNQAIEHFGVEFFEDLLAGYGDFESPVWHILEEHRNGKSGLKRAPKVLYQEH